MQNTQLGLDLERTPARLRLMLGGLRSLSLSPLGLHRSLTIKKWRTTWSTSSSETEQWNWQFHQPKDTGSRRCWLIRYYPLLVDWLCHCNGWMQSKHELIERHYVPYIINSHYLKHCSNSELMEELTEHSKHQEIVSPCCWKFSDNTATQLLLVRHH